MIYLALMDCKCYLEKVLRWIIYPAKTKEREIRRINSESLFFANGGYFCGQAISASFNRTKKFQKTDKKPEIL